MAIEQYEAAELALLNAMDGCREVFARVDGGLVSPDHAEGSVNEYLLGLLEALDDAFTSTPDPRDDPRAMVARTEQSLDDLAQLFDTRPDLALRDSPGVSGARGFLRSRIAQADQIVQLLAVVVSWEQATPALAPLRVRRHAIETLELATQLTLQGGFLTRMVHAGLHAFGPRWAIDLAARYLDRHLVDREFWNLLLVAMDELAAWAAATQLHGIPDEFRRRSISALIEIAGHPELTEWAIIRVPLHRLTQPDRRELGGLLADRYEVMPIDWVSDAQEDATAAVEVAYLKTLEHTVVTWPGAVGRAE